VTPFATAILAADMTAAPPRAQPGRPEPKSPMSPLHPTLDSMVVTIY
jgi:hypothetical protein